MASDIVRSAQDIATLIEALADSPDPAIAKNLKNRTQALQQDLQLIQGQIADLASNKASERAQAILALRHLRSSTEEAGSASISGRSVGEPSEPMRIDTFFEQVTNAVVSAQSRLNSVSLDYVRNLDPRIAPAYFSIPTLKAELKVGFQSSKSRGLNLILFSNAEDKQAYGESTVTFDLVAAPPPPGAVPAGELVVPTPRFLMLGEDRERLLETTRRLTESQGKHLGAMYDNTLHSGLAQVVRFERPTDGASRRYLVLWPSQQTGTKDPSKWREVLLVPLMEDGEGLRFDSGFKLESGQPFLVLSHSKNPATDDAKLAADLGATLNAIAVAIREWSLATRLSTVLPPLPPTVT